MGTPTSPKAEVARPSWVLGPEEVFVASAVVCIDSREPQGQADSLWEGLHKVVTFGGVPSGSGLETSYHNDNRTE